MTTTARSLAGPAHAPVWCGRELTWLDRPAERLRTARLADGALRPVAAYALDSTPLSALPTRTGWLITTPTGVIHLRRDGRTVPTDLPPANLITTDPAGRLWLATPTSLLRADLLPLSQHRPSSPATEPDAQSSDEDQRDWSRSTSRSAAPDSTTGRSDREAGPTHHEAATSTPQPGRVSGDPGGTGPERPLGRAHSPHVRSLRETSRPTTEPVTSRHTVPATNRAEHPSLTGALNVAGEGPTLALAWHPNAESLFRATPEGIDQHPFDLPNGHLGEPRRIAGELATALAVDRTGQLWAATPDGLRRVGASGFTIPIADPTGACFAASSLVISTAKGLHQYDIGVAGLHTFTYST